jgi:hypothetical protein
VDNIGSAAVWSQLREELEEPSFDDINETLLFVVCIWVVRWQPAPLPYLLGVCGDHDGCIQRGRWASSSRA